MRAPRNLLTTWETWSARNTPHISALTRATTDQERDILRQGPGRGAPLDVLRDAAEACPASLRVAVAGRCPIARRDRRATSLA